MMIKNLSKSIANKGIGFNVREDLNFSDDGNRFRGFDYKGMPITTLRADDTTYLCVRVDYLENSFTYHEWMQTEEYRLADEFNGVSEIDLDKLIENCERIIAKVAEMNAKAEAEVIDMTEVKVQAQKEIELINRVLDEAKKNLRWWEIADWKLRYAKDAMNSLLRELTCLEAYIDMADKMSRQQKKSLVEMLERSHYLRVKEDGFYINNLREAMA